MARFFGVRLRATLLELHSSVPRYQHRCVSTFSADYVVIGAGIIGINVANVLKARQPTSRVVVVDKEPAVGQHASGRNSGVLHAGFYYTPDSLKAQLTRDGNRFLTEYCSHKGLALNRCGKLVVARNESDLVGLDTLLQRGIRNGVAVEEVSVDQAKRLEPLVKTHKRALWSPDTSAADPLAVLSAQVEDATSSGVEVRLSTAVKCVRKQTASGPAGASSVVLDVESPDGSSSIEAGHVINCAGLNADKVAHSLGFGQDMVLLPFKGLYLYCDIPLKRLVYPVPDLHKPFLGVHFTVTFDGKSKIGPTAIPAFWREQYGHPGPQLKGFNLQEMSQVLSLEAELFLTQRDFRSLALEEVKKYQKSYMVKGASELVEGATIDRFTTYGRAGIRAQLLNTKTKKLVMDYVVEGDSHSTHVLNAVSPAWTCSRPFAELVVGRVLGDAPWPRHPVAGLRG